MTPLTDRDPGDEQAVLFVDPPVCRHCGTADPAKCQHNLDADPIDRRPRGCIASAQLSPDQPLPF